MDDAQKLAGQAAQHELHQAQIETATSPCDSLEDLAGQLRDLRGKMAAAAGEHGTLVVASGTFPGPMGRAGELITAKDRYQTMAEENPLVARETLICGCHVHVSVDSADVAVAVMSRIRRWLPYVLALSANSPYWEGEDTGFASYRTEVWTRWPTSGPPGEFADGREYWKLLDDLVAAEVILDQRMAYWDVRPSKDNPTVEIRVADVAMTVDDAVAVAGLVRGLVVYCTSALGTSSSASPAGPPPKLRHELLRAATWLAAKHGIGANLLDPLDATVRPAAAAIEQLMDVLTPALRHLGDLDAVSSHVERILRDGNGADRQRRAMAGGGSLADVIRLTTVGPASHPV